MNLRLLVASLVLCTTALLGCGSKSTQADPVNATPPSAFVYTDASGNWQFNLGLPLAAFPSLPTGANLFEDTSTGIVTGAMVGPGLLCTPSSGGGISAGTAGGSVLGGVSGNVDKSGLLTLSGNDGGRPYTISGQLSTDGGLMPSATLLFSSGCSLTTSLTVSASRYASLVGTFSGTLQDVNSGNQGSVTLTLTQQPVIVLGTTMLELSGQTAVSGKLCLTGGSVSGNVYGQSVLLNQAQSLGTFTPLHASSDITASQLQFAGVKGPILTSGPNTCVESLTGSLIRQ